MVAMELMEIEEEMVALLEAMEAKEEMVRQGRTEGMVEKAEHSVAGAVMEEMEGVVRLDKMEGMAEKVGTEELWGKWRKRREWRERREW